jgi:uncharacterized protein YcgI (DUF1989 family)
LSLVPVPASSGAAVAVRAGQQVAVVDVEGGQVGDLFAFNAADPAEHLSAAHTRSTTWRLFPRPGEAFVSSARRPMLTLVEDTSSGDHDMLVAACDAERYRQLGVPGWHPSCAENLDRALATVGVVPPCIPQPVNVFMPTVIDGDGSLQWRPAKSSPGERFVLRAEMDLVVVLTACAQDVTGLNGGRPTPMALEVLG